MRLKTNLVISVVFAVLLGFVYFHEFKGGEARELEGERARQLIDFSDHEAQRLTIDHGDTTIVIEKNDTGWMITQPVSTGADDEAVDRYLRSLKETEMEGDPVQDSSAVAADPSVLATYGLDVPQLRVHLGLTPSAGIQLDTLRFGNDTPTERFTYVQKSGVNPGIRTVRAWRFDNLDKSLFDLRDRKVLHFDSHQVTALTLLHREAAALQRVAAERRDGGWHLTAPLQTKADAAAFDEILTRLGNARILSFPHEQPDVDDYEQTGLGPDRERVDLTLFTGADNAQMHLRLGSKQDHGNHFAVDTSRKPIFVIDSTVVRQLTKPLADLRDRQPFNIPPETVEGIDLVIDGDTRLGARRDSTGTGWQLTYPEGRQATGWRLNDLLTSLSEIRVVSFVADAEDILSLNVVEYGFDKPSLRMVLHLGAGESIFIEMVDSQEGLYARRADVPSIFAIESQVIEDLSPGLEEVSSKIDDAPSTAAEASGEIHSEDQSWSGDDSP